MNQDGMMGLYIDRLVDNTLVFETFFSYRAQLIDRLID